MYRALAIVAALGFFAAGCTVITVTGKAVSTTVGAATDVTAAAVRGTGHVAAAAVGATGDVADEGVRVAGKLSKSGMVVFFDPHSGSRFETPWIDGMKLLGAAASAKVEAGYGAARIIRAGKAITALGPATSFPVKAGDVVELVRG